ncbi:Oligopeptide transporter OPT superfamily [Artemisia annua]|uniref:Oligopeptide transporter OPT superfamily n=1 Tax=Artemisia annua TaxID=35608 RepID=A0A2U1LSS8_ARTAN|nr:Oligopeptide transporter OPT superfamily [Artemisia annua]
MAYNYGKVALFVIAAMSGNDNGVLAGLVGCGLLKSIVSISSDLMHDFKTGHLTITSPRSMLVSQAIGTAIGCVVSKGSQHCHVTAYSFVTVFFTFAMLANLVRDKSPTEIGQWVPLPMAMAVPFLVGAYFAIDMCMGSLVVFIWHKINKQTERIKERVDYTRIKTSPGNLARKKHKAVDDKRTSVTRSHTLLDQRNEKATRVPLRHRTVISHSNPTVITVAEDERSAVKTSRQSVNKWTGAFRGFQEPAVTN